MRRCPGCFCLLNVINKAGIMPVPKKWDVIVGKAVKNEISSDESWCSEQGRQEVLCLSIRIRITHSRFLCGFPACLLMHACTYCVRVRACVWGCLALCHITPCCRIVSDCRWQGWFFMWMNGRACVTTVQMQFPYLYHKWNSTGTLSWFADLPGLWQNTEAARWDMGVLAEWGQSYCSCRVSGTTLLIPTGTVRITSMAAVVNCWLLTCWVKWS